MKLCISVIATILILANAALGGVGDSGVSDGAYYSSFSGSSGSESYPSTATGPFALTGPSAAAGGASVSGSVTGFQATSPYGDSSGGYSPDGYSSEGYSSQQQQYGDQGYDDQGYGSQGYDKQSYSQGQTGQPQSKQALSQGQPVSASPGDVPTAPDASGPYQEKLTPEDLSLQQPTAESFQPDGSLNFASATPPSVSTTTATSVNWPGYSATRNKFYVQTTKGFSYTAGCAYGGHLPLWTDIGSSGNLYVYEWYPGQWTPYVRWWGWTWPGFKKAWFTGDVTGWHVLCYNSKDWSNYVYIYVWPSSGSGSGYSGSGYGQTRYSAQTEKSAQSSQVPYGAPTTPDLNREKIVLPEVSQIPQAGQVIPGGQSGQASSSSSPAQMAYQYQGYQYQGKQYQEYQGQSGYIVPYSGSNQGCKGVDGCSGQSGYQAVYPSSAVQKCNQYYVQTYPGKLSTVAGVRCGEYLCLWSKIGSPGTYWSSEWSACGGYPSGYYCSPEIKNFGQKWAGWSQTWFRADKPGWHVLSYCCNEWSNYVYVYVYPAS